MSCTALASNATTTRLESSLNLCSFNLHSGQERKAAAANVPNTSPIPQKGVEEFFHKNSVE